MYRALDLHLNYVLSTLYELHSITVSDTRRYFLFLQTATGLLLETKHVNSSTRTFSNSFDPELAKVTSMTLRAGIATMVLQKYERGVKFAQLQEKEFLEQVIKLMNTSAEQPKEKYMSSECMGFQRSAKVVRKILDSCSLTDRANHNIFELL